MEKAANQINRTDYTKYTTYWGDGYGRDSYIVTGNGGLRGYMAPEAGIVTGYNARSQGSRLQINQNHQFQRGASKKETTVFKYFGDGTGRDNYVVIDCGGLIPKYVNKGV